jgi:DNA polymerase-3 subunit gamma/tau
MLEIANRCDTGFKASQNQRLFVEIALLQMSTVVSEPLIGSETPASTQGKRSEPAKRPPIQKKEVAAESSVPKQSAEIKADDSEPVPIKKPEKKVSSTDHITEGTSTKTPSGSAGKTPASSKQRMTISIKDRLSGNDPDGSEQAIDRSKLPKDGFTEKRVQELWIEYADSCKADGRHQFATTLTMNKPVVRSEFEIEFPVTNSVQQAEVQDNLEKISEYFQKKLNNFHILISCVITETPSEEAKPYTTSEKFHRMAEKNPDMNELRQQFDLDFD